MEVEVTLRGPALLMSEAQIARRLNGAMDEVLEAVGREVHRDWQGNMRRDFRHPTGAYWSRVVIVPRPGIVRVTDNFVIYGAWLEGTSRRNARTRFKGYAGARRAAQQVEREVPKIARPVLERALGVLR
jgi:hypothetical protein